MEPLIKKIFAVLPVSICLLFSPLFSSGISDHAKAFEYLNKKGEVYFRFPAGSRAEINNLSRILSIDKINGSDVYAYANREEFGRFLESNRFYEVQPHPGDLITGPRMYTGNPGESYEWDSYPTYDAYITMMHQFETDYPGLCKIHDIGDSENGRKILVAQISDNVDTEEKEPGYFVASTMHGDETCGYVLMLRMIDYLLSNYGIDNRVTRIVDSIVMWINPNLNPDGTYSGGNNTVFQARRANANNVDLNRNYPNHIGGEHPDNNQYQKETLASMQFEKQHNMVMGLDLHGGVEAALTPWACTEEKPFDNDWFLLIVRQYRDLVQANSPSGYFTGCNNGIGNGAGDLYVGLGNRFDWGLYYNHCRGFVFEMSDTKILPENQLNAFWDYHWEAMLTLYEQVLNGIRGTVTDSITGDPLMAKVFVENHDVDSAHVWSQSLHGDYYRPIHEGTYDVLFSCTDYYPKTIRNVAVKNGEATILDVELLSTTTGTQSGYSEITLPGITVTPHNNSIQISCTNNAAITKVTLFNLNGRQVKTKIPQSAENNNSIIIEGARNGCYLVQVQTRGHVYYKRAVLAR